MEKYIMILALLWSNLWLISCTRRKRSDTNQKFHKTGEPIAEEYLIQKYEREHQKLYDEEISNGNHLEWPYLRTKNLSDYCRKYLQYSVPGRKTESATGFRVKTTLHYAKVYTNITHEVVTVQCGASFNSHRLTFYMTRAPEQNCVYALKSAGNRINSILTIIHKHCDFEDEKSNKSPKWKWKGNISIRHRKTGQPVASDEHLLKYELEHQEMVRKEGEGECIEWSFAMANLNLDSYCYQYVRKCAPSRKQNIVTGYWKTEKMHYEKLGLNMEIRVTIITCQIGGSSKRFYHITRAPETKCVYALLQKGRGPGRPFAIIFKHCNFEDLNGQQSISQCHDTFDQIIIPKAEVKEEITETLEPLQFFPTA